MKLEDAVKLSRLSAADGWSGTKAIGGLVGEDKNIKNKVSQSPWKKQSSEQAPNGQMTNQYAKHTTYVNGDNEIHVFNQPNGSALAVSKDGDGNLKLVRSGGMPEVQKSLVNDYGIMHEPF